MKFRDSARDPVVSLLLGGFVYELAQGQRSNPYGLILGIAGVTYLAALLWLRWPS